MLRLRVFVLTMILAAGVAVAQKPNVPDYDLVRKTELHDLNRWRSLDADSSHSYDMLELELDYRVENAAVPATGVASLIIAALEQMSIIPFNAEDLQITAVHELGTPLTFFHQNDTVYVERAIVPGDTITLDFTLSVPVIANNSDVGYHVAWNHAYTFTEPYGSRRWFPCFDQPFDKFNRATLAVNMPDWWSLAANGSRVETSFPEAGRKREVYVHDHPISTYLVMICAGEYSEHHESVNGVEYRYFAFPEDSLAAAYDWERTPQMVELFNGLFGNYPFAEYGMVQAAIFNGWGAMEHQTFTTYGFNLVDSMRTFEYIVAHELAHMWFGDALSPVDFRNMWLNEGFATYGDALW